jgi:YCII-related domain-containing protein
MQCRKSSGLFVVWDEPADPGNILKGAQEMANFVLVYTGGSRPASEAEGKKVMEAWGAWLQQLGDKFVDPGSPFSPNAKMLSNGTVHDGAVGTPASGYSILKADSLDAASELARGCPILKSGGQVTVYEVTPM